MAHLVAFLDVLGTSQRTKSGLMHPFEVLDLVNVVGFAARRSPDLRFAAFSDSVVVSADENFVDLFVVVLAFLYKNWFSDLVFVRGGISLGAINWIDHESDIRYRALANFQYARVYGSALVEAQEVEKSSGPGAISFLSGGAADRLRMASSSFVVPGLVPMLAWADKASVRFFSRLLSGSNSLSEPHARATRFYFEKLTEREQFLPESPDTFRALSIGATEPRKRLARPKRKPRSIGTPG